MGVFTGSPPEYDILKIPGTPSMRPPGFNYASNFFDWLQQLIGMPAPSYQGSMDPGMSPTMQAMGNLSQMYANSPLPAVFGQAQGALSRFINPSFTNPMARMQYGAPSYFGNQYGPGQWLPGGSKLGELPYAGGMTPFKDFPTAPSASFGPQGPPKASYGPTQVPPRGPMATPTGTPSYGPTPAAPHLPFQSGGPTPAAPTVPQQPSASYGPGQVPSAGYYPY